MLHVFVQNDYKIILLTFRSRLGALSEPLGTFIWVLSPHNWKSPLGVSTFPSKQAREGGLLF